MNNLINDIPETKHSDFLSELLTHYVDKQGLGGIQKADLDALIVYLYTKYSDNNNFDAFDLSQRFSVKEPRVKSLYETGLIKYSDITEEKAWVKILEKLTNTRFELESNEKAQIRFKFEDPALYKFFQKRIRVLGGTAPYSSTHETITITLELFFDLLEHLSDKSESQFATKYMKQIKYLVERVIQQVFNSFGEVRINELKGTLGLKTKAGKVLKSAAELATIGSYVSSCIML